MTDCPCGCHGRHQAPCDIPGGCGHLHRDTSTDEKPDWPERPATACVLCPRPLWRRGSWYWPEPPRGYRTCDPCLARLRGRLTELAERYARLDPTRGVGDGTRGAPGYASASPANDTIIAITDPRSERRDPTDPRSVPRELAAWIVRIWWQHNSPERWPLSLYRERRSVARLPADHHPHDVAGACEWIDQHLDWATRRDDVTDLAIDLRRLIGQLKSIEEPKHSIGPCPGEMETPGGPTRCGAMLRAPERGDTVHCNRCGSKWERSQWLFLGDLMEAS